jgi:enoyl-CoA hydratase/carnithine racemase
LSAYSRLRLAIEEPVARITRARPDGRNAFDELLIAELTHALGDVALPATPTRTERLGRSS